MFSMSDILEIKKSIELGRYMVAKKDFEIGERVFVESPLVIVPSPISSTLTLDDNDFVCVGCYKVVQKETSVCCKKCLWYACSENCTEEKWHKEYECSVFSARKIEPTISSLEYFFLVRSLICREVNPAKFSKLLTLETRFQTMNDTLKYKLNKFTGEAQTFLTIDCGFSVELKTVNTLTRIFAVNRFQLKCIDRTKNRYHGQVLFAMGCLLAHSCCPNLHWVIPSSEDPMYPRWHLTLHATRKIKSGDLLSIPYTLRFKTKGIIERRIGIFRVSNFECFCERCLDPSEFGTYFSGILCEKCGDVLLPEHTLNFHTGWKCVKCSNTMEISQVENLEKKFDLKLAGVLSQDGNKGFCYYLDGLITQSCRKYGLHANHNLVIRATMHWLLHMNLDVLLKNGPNIDYVFYLMTQRTLQCIEVYSKIGGYIELVKCEAMMALIIIKYRFKSKNGFTIEYDEYTLSEKRSILTEILMHLQSGLKLKSMSAFNGRFEVFINRLEHAYSFWRKKFYEVTKPANIQDGSLETQIR